MTSLLQVNKLTRFFGGLAAVQNVSFTLETGKIMGLIGPNGAGKTTTFSLLTGFVTPTAGDILFDGKRLNGLKPHQICELGLTRTFQIVQPFPELTVLENVMMGAFVRHKKTADARKKAMHALEQADPDRT
jgi:ABC-type branched-subunit amino acid transport system ATPase component